VRLSPRNIVWAVVLGVGMAAVRVVFALDEFWSMQVGFVFGLFLGAFGDHA
jgi:hypothetical protein